MDPEAFRNIIEWAHRAWLARVTGIPSPGRTDIDHFDDEVGFELKSRYAFWGHRFAIHSYQKTEFPKNHPGKELHWAFLLYGLSQAPREIDEEERDLEPFVTKRDVWFLEWDWVNGYDVSVTKTGPYIYVGLPAIIDEFQRRTICKEVKTYRRGNGKLYVPTGTLLERRIQEASTPRDA